MGMLTGTPLTVASLAFTTVMSTVGSREGTKAQVLKKSHSVPVFSRMNSVRSRLPSMVYSIGTMTWLRGRSSASPILTLANREAAVCRAVPSSMAALACGTVARSRPSALPPSPLCRASRYSRTGCCGLATVLFTRFTATMAPATASMRPNSHPAAILTNA